MAPPSQSEIMKICQGEYTYAHLDELIRDYVPVEDLQYLIHFMTSTLVKPIQVSAILRRKYRLVGRSQKDDHAARLTVHFDFNGMEPHKLDGPLPVEIMELVLSKQTTAGTRYRILKGLIDRRHLEAVCRHVEKHSVSLAELDSILTGQYLVKEKSPMIVITQQLDIKSDGDAAYEDQIKDIQAGKYTVSQLVRLFEYQFTTVEIKAIYDAHLSVNQIKRLLDRSYEIVRNKDDVNRKGTYIIKLYYKKSTYRQYLQSMLNGEYPIEEMVRVFNNRLSAVECEVIMGMGLTMPELHALIIGDYEIDRVHSKNGTYEIDINYKEGQGYINEIEDIRDTTIHVLPKQGARRRSRIMSILQSLVPRGKETKVVDCNLKSNFFERRFSRSISRRKPNSRQNTNEASFLSPMQHLSSKISSMTRLYETTNYLHSSADKLGEPNNHHATGKIVIPDLKNESEWKLEKAGRLKVPKIFAQDVMPNFHKSNVKHLDKDHIKDYNETKANRQIKYRSMNF